MLRSYEVYSTALHFLTTRASLKVSLDFAHHLQKRSTSYASTTTIRTLLPTGKGTTLPRISREYLSHRRLQYQYSAQAHVHTECVAKVKCLLKSLKWRTIWVVPQTAQRLPCAVFVTPNGMRCSCTNALPNFNCPKIEACFTSTCSLASQNPARKRIHPNTAWKAAISKPHEH